MYCIIHIYYVGRQSMFTWINIDTSDNKFIQIMGIYISIDSITHSASIQKVYVIERYDDWVFGKKITLFAIKDIDPRIE